MAFALNQVSRFEKEGRREKGKVLLNMMLKTICQCQKKVAIQTLFSVFGS